MHWSDLLIIYLSCGAPFGVYYFLQKRGKSPKFGLFLRSCAALMLWIPFAYLLWRKNVAKRFTEKEFFSPSPEISLLEQQSAVLQEQILQAFVELNCKAGLNLHFFAFRDVLQRYIGLTLAVKANETAVGENDFEIFRIAGRKKKELSLAGKCLAKRNSMRLKSHQSKSREDFFGYLEKLAAFTAVNLNGNSASIFAFRDLILELFELIDVKSLQRAENIFESKENVQETAINGFHRSEVVTCQPPLQPEPQTQTSLRSSPLQMRQPAE